MMDIQQILETLQAPSPAPLHARLRSILSHQITNGTLKPGTALPSERVLHESLGISRATVRQALRGLVEAGLVQPVAGSGNFVLERGAPLQSTLRLVGQPVVGLVVSLPSFHIYYGQMAAVFSQRLRQAGWSTDMALHNDRAEKLQEVITRMLLQNVRVFSINPPTEANIAPILDDLVEHGALVQLLGRQIDYPRCDYVGADNEGVGLQATRHLIDLGHTGIAYLGGTLNPTARDRANGYLRAMQDAGLPPRMFSLFYQQELALAPQFAAFRDAENSAAALFEAIVRRDITAVFCFNDEEAAWLYHEIRQFSLSVPRDLSLVSVDNMPFYGYFESSLTTFALPGEEVGQQAADLLARRLAGESLPPQRILIPARFVQRLSTAPPRR